MGLICCGPCHGGPVLSTVGLMGNYTRCLYLSVKEVGLVLMF